MRRIIKKVQIHDKLGLSSATLSLQLIMKAWNAIDALGLFGLFFLLVGGIELYTSLENYSLEQNGIIVTGEVVGKSFESFDMGGVSYYIHYRFFVREQDYRDKVDVSFSVYNEYQRESLIPVRYMPNKPKISTMDNGKKDGVLSLFWYTGILLLIGIILIIISVYTVQKTRHTSTPPQS